ncbi:MAG: 50S ribosomal protein P1 [Candidatus Brockarchaeota archaeon]|nr:50S ribosomal protein P1 [Candidatus Brockarchaeota archaeon]
MSEYVHAALLLHAVKKEITEDSLKAVVKAAGIDPDEARIKALVASLAEVNVDEVLSSAAAVPAVAAPQVSQPTEAKKPEEKKEEEKKEEEITGLGALFG